MKVRVELLRWGGPGAQPKLLHSLSHESHSLEIIRATVQGMIDSPDVSANGYHIITDTGDELFGSAQRSFRSRRAARKFLPVGTGRKKRPSHF